MTRFILGKNAAYALHGPTVSSHSCPGKFNHFLQLRQPDSIGSYSALPEGVLRMNSHRQGTWHGDSAGAAHVGLKTGGERLQKAPCSCDLLGACGNFICTWKQSVRAVAPGPAHRTHFPWEDRFVHIRVSVWLSPGLVLGVTCVTVHSWSCIPLVGNGHGQRAGLMSGSP